MKSARERADEALYVAHDRDRSKEQLRIAIGRMFEEHARDQRHICAETAGEAWRYDDCVSPPSVAHGAVMNAPAPGEQR